jgi:hypothetical protein
LCNAGCQKEDFAGLLFAVCTVAPLQPFRTNLIDLSGVSKAELKRLPKALRSLADLIRRVNETPLAPAHDLLPHIPTDSKEPRHMKAQMVVRFYRMLPGIMFAYGTHLERFAKFNRRMLKRLTSNHLHTMRLLRYVEECTGSPKYEDLANLLTQGFLAAGGPEDSIPKFFTADALAKLHQRSKLAKPTSADHNPRT